MANSNFQYNIKEEIPDKVDAKTFNKICEKILGFSKKEF
jgi:hypothetical protein